jgi:hypothetical protein
MRPQGIARSSLSSSYARHENVMLVVFLVAVVFMFAFSVLMGYLGSGKMIVQRIDFGKYEIDRREMDASRALGQARYFDQANPYEDKEIVAARYADVASRYPGTQAAKEALEMADKVMQRRR